MEVALGYYEDSDDELFDSSKKRPPANGIEYLKQVQYEVTQHPEVFTAPYLSTENNTEAARPKSQPIKQKCLSADYSYLPDEKSQMRCASDFVCLRQAFTRYKNKNKSKMENSKKIPKKSDIDTWCRFCFGDNFIKQSNDVAMDENMIYDSEFECGNPPLLGLICQINPSLAIQLLEYHLIWFNKKGFTIEQGRWLFALMLCIDKPTPPDALSCLRSISRKFSQFRVKAAANDDVEILYQLYFFIIIVSKYFCQSDLELT